MREPRGEVLSFTNVSIEGCVVLQAWADHGAPEEPDGLLSFLAEINQRMALVSQSNDPPDQVKYEPEYFHHHTKWFGVTQTPALYPYLRDVATAWDRILSSMG